MPTDYARNSLSSARQIQLKATNSSFRDWVGSTDQNDYYRFNLTGRSSFNLSLVGLTANANVELRNSRNVLLNHSAQSGRTSESIRRVLDPGTYFIRVYPATTQEQTYYSLNVSAAPAPAYQRYTYKYSYGNGEYYTGYGFASYNTYKNGQILNDSNLNELGLRGNYQITSVTTNAGTTSNLNKVWTTLYYNVETGSTHTPASGSGGQGLGSEQGYLFNGSSISYFGGRYYEADPVGYQYYTFKYSYGGGDYYTGYGYADYWRYNNGQSLIDASNNETGHRGSYQITSVVNYWGTHANANKVWVNSYYNSENASNYTPVSGSGSSGLGSEYGYIISGNSNSYFGGRYYEADLVSYLLNITDSLYSSSSNSEQDTFTFSVSQAGYVDLNLFNMTQNVNLYVYNSSNFLVGHDREYGTENESLKLWLNPGSYTVKTLLYGGDVGSSTRSTSYQLTAAFAGGTKVNPLDIQIASTGFTSNQQRLLNLAADYWEGIILGLPGGGQSRQITVDFTNKLLGSGTAGLAYSSFTSNGDPNNGRIEFNSSLVGSWDDAKFFSVALHELGHIVGVGSSPRWDTKVSNYRFTGKHASYLYAGWLRAKQWRPTSDGGVNGPRLPIESAIYVPLTDTGGEGSIASHWDEQIFDRELMTDYSESNDVITPMSWLTIASMKDIGYEVNYAMVNRPDIFNQLGFTWHSIYNIDYYVSDINWAGTASLFLNPDTRAQNDIQRYMGDFVS